MYLLLAIEIVYIENFQKSIAQLLQLICEFSKATGGRVDTQKSVVCLHTSSKQLESEWKYTHLHQHQGTSVSRNTRPAPWRPQSVAGTCTVEICALLMDWGPSSAGVAGETVRGTCFLMGPVLQRGRCAQIPWHRDQHTPFVTQAVQVERHGSLFAVPSASPRGGLTQDLVTGSAHGSLHPLSPKGGALTGIWITFRFWDMSLIPTEL